MEPTEQILGTVIFAKSAVETDHATVVAAAESAGMPEKLVKEIRPRSAFIRAMRALVKDGILKADIRDKTRDDEKALTFAFVMRSGADTLVYNVEALVKLDKEAAGGEGAIEIVEAPYGVDRKVVLARANQLIVKARNTWLPQDVNQLVKVYVGQHARKLPLRAGVSFVTYQAEGVVKSLKQFYTQLGIQFWALPLGHSAENATNLHQVIVDDMRAQVDALVAEVQVLKADGKLTKRVSKNRIAELQKSLWQYRDLAEATRVTMEDLAEAAGGQVYAIAQSVAPMDTLLAMASEGKIAPVMVDLLAADESDPTAQELQRVMSEREAPEIPMPDPVSEDIAVDDSIELPLFPVFDAAEEAGSENGED